MPINRKSTTECGLLLRMTPKLVEGKEVPAIDVLNLHIDFLDQGSVRIREEDLTKINLLYTGLRKISLTAPMRASCR